MIGESVTTYRTRVDSISFDGTRNASVAWRTDAKASGATMSKLSSYQVCLRTPRDEITIDVNAELRGEELFADLRETLAEILPFCFYTNYAFEYEGQRIENELLEIQSLVQKRAEDVKKLLPPVLSLVPERYDDRSLRCHVHRVRNILLNPSVVVLTANSLNLQNDPEQMRQSPAQSPPCIREILNQILGASLVDFSLFSDMGSYDLNGTTLSKKVRKFFQQPECALPEKTPCLNFIRSSAQNPPLRHERLQGLLWKYEIKTLEDETLHVTAAESGFFLTAKYKSGSSTPSEDASSLNTTPWASLHDLLADQSPLYAERVSRIALDLSTGDSTLPNKLLQCIDRHVAWVDVEHDHPSERACRWGLMEERLELSPWDSLRDWNNEAQCVRELPPTNAEFLLNRQHFTGEIRHQQLQQSDETQEAPNCSFHDLQRPSVTSMNFEEAQIIQERNFLKVLTDLKAMGSLAAVNVREGRLEPLSDGEDFLEKNRLKPDPTDVVDGTVYAWNNFFLVPNIFPSLTDPMNPAPKPMTPSNFTSTPLEYGSRRGLLADFRATDFLTTLPTIQPLLLENESVCAKVHSSSCPPLVTRDEAGRKNLYTLLSTVTDYAGVRILAQALAPGLLATEPETTNPVIGPQTGSLNTYAMQKDIMDVIYDKIGCRLGLLKHHVRPTNATSEPVTLCMPFEFKVFRGTDGRQYMVDAARIFPIDTNWLSEDQRQQLTEGTWDNSAKATALSKRACLYCVRPELLEAFLWMKAQQRKVIKMDPNVSAGASDDLQRELRAHARFAWIKSLGLHTNPDFVSHATLSRLGQHLNPSLWPLVTPYDQQWPGLDIFLTSGLLQWDTTAQNASHMISILAKRWVALYGKRKHATISVSPRVNEEEQQQATTDSSPVDQFQSAESHTDKLDGPVSGNIGPELMKAYRDGGEKAVSRVLESAFYRMIANEEQFPEQKTKDAHDNSHFEGGVASITQPPSLFNLNLSLPNTNVDLDHTARVQQVAHLYELGDYLKKVALVCLVDHLVGNSADIFPDSTTLSSLFHAFGVNMRYLGDVLAETQKRFLQRCSSKKNENTLPILCDVLEREILARSIVFYLGSILCRCSLGESAVAAAYMLTLVFRGSEFVSDDCEEAPGLFLNLPTCVQGCSQQLWTSVLSWASAHFRYNVNPEPLLAAPHHRYAILRTVCVRLGIKLSFSALARVITASTPASLFFSASDICDFQPIIKPERSKGSIARLLAHAGVIGQLMDMNDTALDCYQSSNEFLHQATSTVTRESVFLSMASYGAVVALGDPLAAYVQLQKVLITTQRTLGSDHPSLIEVKFGLSKCCIALASSPEEIIAAYQQYTNTSEMSTKTLSFLLTAYFRVLAKELIEDAIALSQLWFGTDFRNLCLPALLVHASKVSTLVFDLAWRARLDEEELKQGVACLSEVTQKLFLSFHKRLPSFTAPMKTANDAVVLLETAFQMTELVHRHNLSSSLATCQVNGELASQFASIGNMRRAVHAARRHRDGLIDLLGHHHIEVVLQDKRIEELTRYAVKCARQEQAARAQSST